MDPNEEQPSLDIIGAPQRPLGNFSHTAFAEDEFTCDPDLIADQADSFEFYRIGSSTLEIEQTCFYLLYRAVRIEAPGGYECDAMGRRWGTHLVAYECDEKGHVHSWEWRYEVAAVSMKAARAKFEFLWDNGLANPLKVAVPFEFEDEQRGI